MCFEKEYLKCQHEKSIFERWFADAQTKVKALLDKPSHRVYPQGYVSAFSVYIYTHLFMFMYHML